MRESEIIRKYIDVIEQSVTDPQSTTDPEGDDIETNLATSPKLPAVKPITPSNEPTGKFVGGNRQISYMTPIGPGGNKNISVGLGKPMNRDFKTGGVNALVTVGGNPGNKRDFVGVQLNQPLGKDDLGQRPGPGVSAIYRKQF